MPVTVSQLGRALSIIAAAEAREAAMHDDVDAFGAPSECHALVAKHEARRLRLARRHAASVAGVRYGLIMREAQRRVSPKALRRAHEACLSIVYSRLCPF